MSVAEHEIQNNVVAKIVGSFSVQIVCVNQGSIALIMEFRPRFFAGVDGRGKYIPPLKYFSAARLPDGTERMLPKPYPWFEYNLDLKVDALPNRWCNRNMTDDSGLNRFVYVSNFLYFILNLNPYIRCMKLEVLQICVCLQNLIF